MIDSNVLLPDPLEPIIEQEVPGTRLRSTPLKTWRVSAWLSKHFDSFLHSMTNVVLDSFIPEHL
jgi:hypothetical protein